VSEFVSDELYVYVQGFAYMARRPAVGIARRGALRYRLLVRHRRRTARDQLTRWKPLPFGRSAHVLDRELYANPNDTSFVRPPEPVYEPAGVDAPRREAIRNRV
jgi:hypothetical protein